MKYFLSAVALVFLAIPFDAGAIKKEIGMKKNLTAAINKKVHVFKDLELVVTEIVYEQIEADPFGGSSYPSGSGVTVYIKINGVGNHTELTLSDLSAPYESKPSADWNGYRIYLLKISDHTNPEVELSIEKLK